MKTNIYQVQSFLTMDEYPNYIDTHNRGYFTYGISPFELFNKSGCAKCIKISETPYDYKDLGPGLYQVAIDTSKVKLVNGVVEEVTPDSIVFIDYPIIYDYNSIREYKEPLYLSNITTVFPNEYDLIDFLNTYRDQLCLDFYDILDILIMYGKISNEHVDKFFATN